MREITCRDIKDTVCELFIQANMVLPCDVLKKLNEYKGIETNTLAKGILEKLEENALIAKSENIPICQDTGLAFVFLAIGQDVHITGGSLNDAVNEGVREAYDKGSLRKSVADPLTRKNTGDNTPAVIYTEIIPGDKLKIFAMPKGFGSENMSRISMMNPTATEDDIIDFIEHTVISAGGNPCPPTVIGVGIGGSFDYSAFLAKKALLRPLGIHNPAHKELESKILNRLNNSGTGPQGFGGDTTSLWVSVESAPTHIASLPVAVNVSCHATRHAEAEL